VEPALGILSQVRLSRAQQIGKKGMNQGKRGDTNSIVFEYDDYRRFLRDFFDEQKRLRAAFSYRYFARKAGLSSPSLVIDVMKGRLNLTMKTLPKVVRGLGLRGRAATFFKTLVLFNQSRDEQGKEEHYEELVRIRRGSKLYKLNKLQYAYFDHWYYPVVRELAAYARWNDDYAELARLVHPPITEAQARKAVETLLELGLLERTPDGGYAQMNPGVSTADVPLAIQACARRDLMKLAMVASHELHKDERYIAHATLSMSEKGYQEATRICDEARRRIVSLALNDSSVEKVYEVMFQAFPLSDRIPGADEK
jgi:uncharacterized protein (TIGR02147 family)